MSHDKTCVKVGNFCRDQTKSQLNTPLLKLRPFMHLRKPNWREGIFSSKTWRLWYCWWTKSCTTKDDDYPIIYRVLTIPGGAGFRPSTVFMMFDGHMGHVGKNDIFWLRKPPQKVSQIHLTSTQPTTSTQHNQPTNPTQPNPTQPNTTQPNQHNELLRSGGGSGWSPWTFDPRLGPMLLSRLGSCRSPRDADSNRHAPGVLWWWCFVGDPELN